MNGLDVLFLVACGFGVGWFMARWERTRRETHFFLAMSCAVAMVLAVLRVF